MTKAEVFMKSNLMQRLNNKFLKFKQTTRVIECKKQSLVLSNNTIISGDEFVRFKRRMLNPKINVWVENLDKLINGIITDKQIKSELSRKGGLACQLKHKDIVRKNLNTGKVWNAGTKGQNIGKLGPRPQHVKDAISLKNSGSGNGMYGHRWSDEEKKKKSLEVKQRILDGKFTPNTNNRQTHYDVIFNGRKYRSSWDAAYQSLDLDACYESLRILYNFEGKSYVYIVDFHNKTTRTVVEVKPASLLADARTQAKLSALTNWAEKNNSIVKIVTESYIKDNFNKIPLAQFDEKTQKKLLSLKRNT